ncbi:MAG TPA: class I SAM-dependent methyltransferase, partial [Aliiroseovarius sp.]|nr:class I SAM-dependent methyltransferase [Aliiroseovarius sp.]
KLLLKPGLRLLDIGCGWGYMACYLAKTYDVHVTGVSLSRTQLQSCAEFARSLGVEDKVDFRYQDYREVSEQFDRIYSVGMLEHVGQPKYATYFRKVYENLADDGIALIHFIGRNQPPGALSPWFNKYIFPGGYTPALSEVTPEVENAGLLAADLEIWRGHYERTLYDWWVRFEANIDAARAMYDERFVRMWRYYLIAAQVAFPEMKSILCHLQLSKDQYRVPNKRDYLYVEGGPAPEPAPLPPPLERLVRGG